MVKLYVWVEPSLALAEPVRLTVGPTLAIATVWLAVLLSAPSLSSTWTETLLEAGPSGNEQTKLPAPVVVLNRAVPTWDPLRPQSVERRAKLSSPGSLVVKLYVWLVPSLTDRSFAPDRLTVGATLLTTTTTTWLSVSDAPSESVTVAVTLVVAGPSAKKQAKLPRPVAWTNVSEPETLAPFTPHAVVTVWVSWPGSVTVYE